MRHDESYCKSLLKKVLEDLKRQRGEEFYDKEAPFEAIYQENKESLFDGKIIKHCWVVYARVPKDGWKGGNIIINIDDDTGKALTFVNTSMGIRPTTFELKIDTEGKYYIPKI